MYYFICIFTIHNNLIMISLLGPTPDTEQTKHTHTLSTDTKQHYSRYSQDTKQTHTCNLHSVYSFLAGGSATAADDGADTAGAGVALTDVDDLFFSAA